MVSPKSKLLPVWVLSFININNPAPEMPNNRPVILVRFNLSFKIQAAIKVMKIGVPNESKDA